MEKMTKNQITHQECILSHSMYIKITESNQVVQNYLGWLVTCLFNLYISDWPDLVIISNSGKAMGEIISFFLQC
jgi:hypothetical protein